MNPQPTSVRWVIFALACAVSWLLYVHRYAWGVIKPTLKAETQLSDVQLGWLDAAFNASYALGQVPGGLLGDVLGPRLVLPVMILTWSGCVAWTGLVGRFWPLAGVRGLFGLAQAGAYPILAQVTRSWFPVAVRTTVQGAVASLSGRAGGACASLLVATLLMGGLGLSWQHSLLLLSALGLGLALAFWALFRDTPTQHPWTNAAEQHLIGDGGTSKKSSAARLHLDGRTRRTMAALLLYAFTSTFADQLYVFWIPQFLVEGKHLSPAQMGLFAGLPLWGGALGGFLGGALNDWVIRVTDSRRFGRSAVALVGKGMAGVMIVVSLFVEDGRLVMVVLFACKFFGDWSLPTQWGTITDISGGAAGTVFGAVNMVGGLAAFVAGPTLGWLKQEHGWEGLFGCVAGMYLVAALCWLVIDCTCQLWREDSGGVPRDRSI